LRFLVIALGVVSLACAACAKASSGHDNEPSGASSGSSGGGGGGESSSSGGASGSSSSGDNGGDDGSPASSGGDDREGGGSGGGSGGGGSGSSGGGGGDAGACGTRTGMRGQTTRSLMVGSTTRTYVAYLPQSASATTPLPFVYVFHGANQTGAELYTMTEYSTLADSDGIAVVFPDGQGASSVTGTGVLEPWNVSDNGAAVCGAGDLANNATGSVDFDFMAAIKTDILQDQCLDSEHTFATGFSMGGYFTHHIACDLTNIRAAAPHSGGTIASLSGCADGHIPIIIFHGTSDALIAPGCDDPNSAAQSGFPPTASLWAQKNGCQTTYTTIPEDGTGGSDGQCYLYDGCPSDGQVELCTFTGLNHAWAGSTTCTSCIGTGAGYVSATQLEWAFFKKYAW
jgi:poly(3-hydroxybutyrate) depolymerase